MNGHIMQPALNLETIKVACSNCNLRELCMPVGFNVDEMKRLDEVVEKRRRVKQGELLFNSGDTFIRDTYRFF